MASITKRPDGVWRARYRDDAGREHSRHFARKLDGRRWLDEVTTSVVTGQYIDPKAGKTTFRAYAEEWRLAAPHGPSMRDKVERALRLHAYPAFGDRALASIRPSTVQAWVTSLPLAPSSAEVVLAHVGSVFRAAVRDRLIMSNPADGARPPAARRAEMIIPEVAAVMVLRENLPPRYRAVIDLALGSGMRWGELLGLELDGLPEFMRSPSVSVHQQLISLSPLPLHLGPVKTEESARVIPLANATRDALAAHLAEFPARTVQIEDRTDRHRPVTRDARLLFTTPLGSPVGRGMWSEVWRPAARAAGIPPRVGIHCLRHWYASALIASGVSVKVVQKRLGHASAAITLDTYGHLMPDSDDRTRDAIETALSASADSLRTARK